MALGICRSTGAKSPYPSGYKRMTGSYTSGTTISIPSNIIPLTLKVSSGSMYTYKGEVTHMYWTLKDNAGNIIWRNHLNGNSRTVDWTGGYLYLPPYYSYNYSALNAITSYVNAVTVDQAFASSVALSTLTVTEWLVKL